MSLRVLYVDDDRFASDTLCAALRDAGFAVDYASAVTSALTRAEQTTYDVAVVDVMMPIGHLGFIETRGGFETGIALARRLKDALPNLKILGITQRETPETEEWFRTNGNGLYPKTDALQNPRGFVRCVADLGAVEPRLQVRAFIVHGHDIAVRDELKQMLEEHFRLTVVVLDEQPSRGRTIIEKFEDEARDVDIVFVLMTPDDVVVDRADVPQRRARQNVLIELGYFLGRLARRRGRVVLLHKQGVEVPSDLHGVVLIDVTHGVESARNAIAKELTELMRLRGK